MMEEQWQPEAQMSSTPTDETDTTMSDLSQEPLTLEGNIFGTRVWRNLGNICLDSETPTHRAGRHGYIRALAAPSDHALVYQDIIFSDAQWRTAAAAARGPPKPIELALHDMDISDRRVTISMDD